GKVGGSVQVDYIQQGIRGDRQHRPPARQLVLVVDVERGQGGHLQLAQRNHHRGRTDRGGAGGGQLGGELVDRLGPAVAEGPQHPPGGGSQRNRRVGQLGHSAVVGAVDV